MSRSRRHIAIAGIAGHSDKHGKRLANRALRRAVHAQLDQLAEEEEPETTPILREVSNVWSMPKDGKRPFDPVKHPKLMRK